MSAAQSRLAARRHLNGEHNHWCSHRKDNVTVCKFTGEQIKGANL